MAARKRSWRSAISAIGEALRSAELGSGRYRMNAAAAIPAPSAGGDAVRGSREASIRGRLELFLG